MSAEAFTDQQLLCGLRLMWIETVGDDDTFDLKTRIDRQLQAEGIWEEIDVMDIARGVEAIFGLRCPKEEWYHFFCVPVTSAEEWAKNVGPHLTFGALADFIRDRLEPIYLEPITLLGKRCLTAGIFRALEYLAGQIHPAALRFAPSTPIRARLRGRRLRQFWNCLRWITEDRIPAPRRIKFGCGSFYFKISIGLFIALWKRDLEGLWLSLKITAILFLPWIFFIEFLNAWLNPLPKEIQTFGDLARYLAVVTENQQPQGA